MASRRGMNIRIDQAHHRIDAALAAIHAAGTVAIPARPDHTRDSALNAAMHAEWVADVLETIAAAPPAPAPDGEASTAAPARPRAARKAIRS